MKEIPSELAMNPSCCLLCTLQKVQTVAGKIGGHCHNHPTKLSAARPHRTKRCSPQPSLAATNEVNTGMKRSIHHLAMALLLSSALSASRPCFQSIRHDVARRTRSIQPTIGSIHQETAPTTRLFSALEDPTLSGYQRPKVNWYPGHIAKAERQLSETLKSVDVVIEVRDARAPRATSHPKVPQWSAGRPRVVVMTRMDAVTGRSREGWSEAFKRFGVDRDEGGEGEKNRNEQFKRERSKYDANLQGGGDDEETNYGGAVEEVLFVDAKRGQGTHAIARAVYRAGRHVNERRRRRGLNDRPLRVGIIGFPNVGKVSLLFYVVPMCTSVSE